MSSISGEDAPPTTAQYGDLMWESVAEEETPCEAVRRVGRLLYLPSPDALEGRYTPLMKRSGIRSYVGVPVRVADQVGGHVAVLDVQLMPPELPVELWSILRTSAERVSEELERGRFRRRFARSERQFRALLETSAEIFLLTDRSGNIVEFDDSVCRKLGCTPEQIRDRPLSALDLDHRTDGLPMSLEVGHPVVVETRLGRSDGTPVPVELTLCVVDWGGERVGLVLGRDISERRRLEEARRQFVEDVVTAQEDERARVARELHDSIGQVLTSLSLQLRVAADRTRDPGAYRQLLHLLKLSEAATAEASALAMGLRPPALDDLGVIAAIEEHVSEVGSRHGLRVDLHARGHQEKDRLPSTVETAMYRITQEALTNVLKHARATAVSILIDRRPEAVRLVIEDDGAGFDPNASRAQRTTPGGLGLPGIKERAVLLGGDFRVESSPGEGTALYVTLPVPASPDA